MTKRDRFFVQRPSGNVIGLFVLDGGIPMSRLAASGFISLGIGSQGLDSTIMLNCS
jgi:hypothetical protein